MHPSSNRQPPSLTGDIAPEGLLAAFWEYDRALLANDVATLDSLFADGPDTIRGDGSTIVTGHHEISMFRTSRTAIPTRRVVTIAVQRVSDEAALIVAGVISPTNARGMQTQLWRRHEGSWKVTTAHLSAPTVAVDKAVWRVVGAPLKAAKREGILSGETLAVKDLFAIEGQAIGAGVKAWAHEASIEKSTAPAVSRLLDAGASVTGLAQTDQLAYSIAGTNADYGTPLNPQAPNRLPGGSSSGPASAVAQGLVTIGLGTDTAGSVRVPASYQGLWGIRTTHGLVPMTGVVGLAPSFDTVGWMTRDGDLLTRVASILVPDTRTSSPPRLVSWPQLTALTSADLGVSFTNACRALGANDVHLDVDFESWFQAFRTVQAYEAWREHGTWITRHPDSLGADVRARFEAASLITRDQAASARSVVADAAMMLRGLVEGRVLLVPAAPGAAPLRSATSEVIEAERARTLRLACLASIAGLPAVVAPMLRASSFAVGLCFIGQQNSDRGLIDTACQAFDHLSQSTPTSSSGKS